MMEPHLRLQEYGNMRGIESLFECMIAITLPINPLFFSYLWPSMTQFLSLCFDINIVKQLTLIGSFLKQWFSGSSTY